ncbi:Metallo-dependent hydrolase [Trametes versicolor FP-101664 SS1]|uniref:Metallo-dependent hydrolase n=1 Tax=Trametes versicolor (strain FP-101664) TaxID=717944 RepID=UPI0004622715|nr:Metallo-dependent hydrolase [Trametes versicolor FP-101664 SS1]EIW59523.1 Metallo-dependent hydrolase [Trametes versicolor FP-101664 SS1]
MGLSQFNHSPSARPKATLAANGRATPSPAFADYPRLVIRNVHLPFDSDDPTLADPLYNVYCVGGRVDSVELATTNGNSHGSRHSTPPHHPEYQAKDRQHAHAELDAQGRGILLPALCHAHIHLDKCFLLDQCDELVTGHFAEALRVTAKAKSAFPHNLEDLFERGRKLITQSVECGVTMMRAHVEVDEAVHFACVDTGLKLQKLYRDICHVQIAVFAQEPLFASPMDDRPGLNYALLQSAVYRMGVEAVGSAPYVEPTIAHAKRNIDYIFELAYEAGLHVDFHLDYNLEPAAEPLVWYVLDRLRERIAAGRWRSGAHLCIGHATRLTLFSPAEWARLRTALVEERLPVTLVALPPSDLYMMGRHLDSAPRSTLNVPRLAEEHGLRVAMAVNNVENAFTPQGPVDPLNLCPLGVAVFQAGTKKDCRALLEAVTLNARLAIGGVQKGAPYPSITPTRGMLADFVLLHENDTLHSAALNPSFSRTTIRHGQVVARRVAQTWILPQHTPSPSPLRISPA